MTEFEKVLEECLRGLEQGDLSLEDCLKRHPTYARQLEPVLLASQYLARGREARPSDAFKGRLRTRLMQQMHAHPRRSIRPGLIFARLATGLAVALLALLATGTAYAQNAMPGEAFYSWKLASESVWRAISPDPVGTDLRIAERRMEELVALRDDPGRYPEALHAYLDVVDRLKSEMDSANEERILAVLSSQIAELDRSGIVVPQPNEATPPSVGEPTPIPLPTLTATPLPDVETPQVNPTGLPQVIPTVQVPQVVPTMPKILPTIEIPPPIP